jgi:hypothetical protein
MTMIEYQLALCGEAFDLFKIWLLIKCRLKSVTIDERAELIKRKKFLQTRMQEIK